ncbi:hypothetical protein BC739_008406 [Kutzneria viridogrisea]|uniref:DUF3558 domain-containing protein n=1 Tax=Kutzneria viridogrisea TaxID=47990 RepID=A0ABR6BW62_9PSEU|nr:hypothetical protein [Kutzneria viridogrisea]
MLAVAACGGGAQGTPSPETTSAAAGTSTTSSASGASLDSVKPCSLLTAAEVTQLGLKESGFSGGDTCQYNNSGSVYVIVTVVKKGGIDELNNDGGTATKMPVGSHQAMKVVKESDNSCIFRLAVTQHSSIGVLAQDRPDKPSACPLAENAAKLVEPKLPSA